MQTFVSKARRPEFELHLRIIDLNNVPLVSGTSFIKWNLPSSTAAEHRGRTPKSTIKDHKVLYDYDKVIPVRLVIAKDQMLQETLIHFEILQEYSSGGKGERITLGVLDLNLSEYVENSPTSPGDDPSTSVSRRYLMQQSKINSTLKIDIFMKHVRGDKNFIVYVHLFLNIPHPHPQTPSNHLRTPSSPPLRTAPVFGGIAGIMSYEADTADDNNHSNTNSNANNIPSHQPGHRSREMGERHDLYRMIVAASWAAAPDQLSADECIEDIFGGGDGWGGNGGRKARTAAAADAKAKANARSAIGDDGRRSRGRDESRGMFADRDGVGGRSSSSSMANISAFFRSADKNTGAAPAASRSSSRRRSGADSSAANGAGAAVSGRQGLDAEAGKLGLSKSTEGSQRNEIDEFDVTYRDDLRSWKISDAAAAR